MSPSREPRPAIEVAASGLAIVAAEVRRGDDVAPGAAIERLVGALEEGAAMSAAAPVKARREFDERDVVACVTHAHHTAAARRDIDLDPEPA